jgi:hypothetical protein
MIWQSDKLDSSSFTASISQSVPCAHVWGKKSRERNKAFYDRPHLHVEFVVVPVERGRLCLWPATKCLLFIPHVIYEHGEPQPRSSNPCKSYSFTTSALDGGEWSASRPGRALPPEKGPIIQEAGWAPELVWTEMSEEKSRLCRGSNLDRPVVESIARHYTDWATPARCQWQRIKDIFKKYKSGSNKP